MTTFGHFALVLAWLLSMMAAAGGMARPLRLSARGQLSLQHATIAASLCLGISVASLAFGFLIDDYSVRYIWEHSSYRMKRLDKIWGVCAGNEGLMLLAALVLSSAGSAVALNAHRYPRALSSWAIAAMNASSAFFLSLVVFFTNPFASIGTPFIPPEGSGLVPFPLEKLNRLYQLILYAGFVCQAVPFAFGIAALIARDPADKSLPALRYWNSIAWVILTFGLALDSVHGYMKHGQAWGMDSFDTLALIPWLLSTALIHSLMLQERRALLKAWNIWLAIVTHVLTLATVFLPSFSGGSRDAGYLADAPLGFVFLGYLSILIAVCAAFTLRRAHEVRDRRDIKSLWSKEAFLVISNLLAVGVSLSLVLDRRLSSICLDILCLPPGALPLVVVSLFAMALGPLFAWQKSTPGRLAGLIRPPLLGTLLFVACLCAVGAREALPLAAGGAAFLSFTVILCELRRGRTARASGPIGESAAALTRRRRREAGHLIHLGIGLMAAVTAVVTAYRSETTFELSKNEIRAFGPYELGLKGLNVQNTRAYMGIKATVGLNKDGIPFSILEPQLRSYVKAPVTIEGAALKSWWREDVYLSLSQVSEDGQIAAFRLLINPFQMWFWFGMILTLAGALILIIPARADIAFGRSGSDGNLSGPGGPPSVEARR